MLLKFKQGNSTKATSKKTCSVCGKVIINVQAVKFLSGHMANGRTYFLHLKGNSEAKSVSINKKNITSDKKWVTYENDTGP